MNMGNKNLNGIVSSFAVEGTVESIEPLGNGLINDTWLVRTGEPSAPDYVLQRINTSVFKDVEGLQNNIVRVTDHLRKKLRASGVNDTEKRVLQFISLASDNKKTWCYDGKDYWRLSRYISGSHTIEDITPDTAKAAGKAFGQFQSDLSDLTEELVETIPDFHNIEFRLTQLKEAIGVASSIRLKAAASLIDTILDSEDEMTLTCRLYREGKLPRRICHCDTKVNNILFDENDNILCVIDLDTVMPSFIFSDYGDFLRTAASNLPEDDPDVERLEFRMDIFKSFTEGYLSQARAFLTPVEIECLPHAVALFPYMQAVRFLTDYLNGDVYYKITYPEHNFVRTRNQLALFNLIRSLDLKIDL